MLDEELVVKARKRVDAKIKFYTDLGAYIIVNIALIAVWYFSGGGFPWFLFVILFWGIGVAANGLAVFRQSSRYESMADAEYQKMLNRNY